MRISDWSSDVCSSDLPDHGPIGLIAVVVPLPPWSEDQIERLHHSFFTIDRCDSPAPLKHETQGALRVSMAWLDFAGQDQLQAGIQARNECRQAYDEIGRRAGRERGGQYGYVLGGRCTFKKIKKETHI